MQELADWGNFYLAGAGAAAALAGLSVVAISANLDAILQTTVLPTRAAATITTMVAALLVCMVGLMSGQSEVWFGVEVLVIGGYAWITKVRASRVMAIDHGGTSKQQWLFETVSGQVQTLPLLIGGVALVLGWSGALVWVGFGVVAAFALSMVSVWVLLVEIRR